MCMGVFKEKQGDLELTDVMFYVLDCWYNEELCKGESDGKERLLEILEDQKAGLYALAQKMLSGSGTVDMIDSCLGEDTTQNRTQNVTLTGEVNEQTNLVGNKEN